MSVFRPRTWSSIDVEFITKLSSFILSDLESFANWVVVEILAGWDKISPWISSLHGEMSADIISKAEQYRKDADKKVSGTPRFASISL